MKPKREQSDNQGRRPGAKTDRFALVEKVSKWRQRGRGAIELKSTHRNSNRDGRRRRAETKEREAKNY